MKNHYLNSKTQGPMIFHTESDTIDALEVLKVRNSGKDEKCPDEWAHCTAPLPFLTGYASSLSGLPVRLTQRGWVLTTNI